MSQWAKANPDNPNGLGDHLRETADTLRDREKYAVQSCVACGTPTIRGRWCSASCHRAEDHYREDDE